MKKSVNLILVIVMLFCFFALAFPVKAASTYDVYLESGNSNTKQVEFSTYKEAYTYAQTREKENQDYNLVIYQNGKVLYATYAIVNFNTKGSATTSYTIEYNNKNVGYTNGAYGADAAFLETTEDGSKVRFKLSGVVGWVNASEVEIINMNAQNYKDKYISSYEIQDGAITHNISSTPHAYKMSRLYLSHEIPKEFQNGKFYLGYDGHYFYTESLAGFRAMIRDYKNNVHTNAINPKTPYYNYYQFLSHRSISNYTSEQLKQEFSNYKAKPVYGQTLQANQSLLFGEETSFIQYQNEFGANALLMYGVAKNESNYGRSPLSIRTNNIFSHSAFDSAPGASASSYASVAQAIYVHSKVFISERYAYPSNSNYFGSFVGDKGSGMNVRYASDPYWGEKAAEDYYKFDKKYGFQDYAKYAIGIKEGTGNYPIKASPSSSSATLYTTGPITNYAVTILSSVNGETINGSNVWYKIQTDATLNNNKTGYSMLGAYDYEYNIGYIHSSYLTYVRNGNKEKKRYTIKFNPNGGAFPDNITTPKSLTVEEFVIPDISSPSKKDAKFIGWDKEVVAATENVTYTAVYKANQTFQITFDANGGKFNDGTTSKVVTTGLGEKPNFTMEPSKDQHVFVGWDKEIVPATQTTTYKAVYQNVFENEDLKIQDSFLYLDNISVKNGKLYIKGFQTIEGINNNLNTNIQYAVMLMDIENPDIDHAYIEFARRLTSSKEIPFPSYGLGKKDYSYAWFELETDFDGVDNGNYVAVVMAYTNHEASMSILSNRMFAPQATSYSGKKEVIIKNDYYLTEQPVEFIVRDRKLANRTTKVYTYNQFDQFFELNFTNDNLLHIKGYTYSYGMDLSKKAAVSRKIIFENKENYQKTEFLLNSIQGDYEPVLPQSDSLSKALAWYDMNLDISKLEKGTYQIYIATTSNISDVATLTDLFNQDLSKITKTINGKTYQFRIVSERGNAVELIVS